MSGLSPPTPDLAGPPTIGMFDSGVGGLSVLAAIRAALPGVALHYVADSAHAPYGERDAPWVAARSRQITRHLQSHGARLLVVACNTATALAIDDLRQQHPDLVFVGVEPGLRPALALSQRRRVGVMATPATLASARLRELVARERGDAHVELVACAGLADAIERGPAGEAQVEALLAAYTAALRAAGVDSVALGCTHYPFVASRIARHLGPEVTLVDTAEAVARRVRQLWHEAGWPTGAAGTAAPVRLQSSGEPSTLERLAADGCGLAVRAEPLNLAA